MFLKPHILPNGFHRGHQCSLTLDPHPSQQHAGLRHDGNSAVLDLCYQIGLKRISDETNIKMAISVEIAKS